MFVYNPYYERWGWINDENLADGKLPYRVKISYSKNKPLGEGRLENINDLIIVDERRYGKGGKTEKFDKSGKCTGYVKSKYDSLCANCGSNKSLEEREKG